MAANPDVESLNENLNKFKWFKVIQSIFIFLLGFFIIFINSSLFNDDVEISYIKMLPLGVVLIVYGLIDIITNYIVKRSPFASDVLLGLVSLIFGIACLANRKESFYLLPHIVITSLLVMSIALLIYSIDIFASSTRKRDGILPFFFFLVTLAIGSSYLVIKVNSQAEREQEFLERLFGVFSGIIIIVSSVIFLIRNFVKVNNTRKYFQAKERQQKQNAKQQKAKTNFSHPQPSSTNFSTSSLNNNDDDVQLHGPSKQPKVETKKYTSYGAKTININQMRQKPHNTYHNPVNDSPSIIDARLNVDDD